jgi:hypothetical protein
MEALVTRMSAGAFNCVICLCIAITTPKYFDRFLYHNTCMVLHMQIKQHASDAGSGSPCKKQMRSMAVHVQAMLRNKEPEALAQELLAMQQQYAEAAYELVRT